MKTTVLILAANPKDTDRLRLDEEVREITLGLQRSRNRDKFQLVHSWATRSIDVRRAILDSQPQIIHFCGHGGGESGIVLESSHGGTHLVNTDALANFFALFEGTLSCVILNACYSELQAEALSEYVPYVIGMADKLSDSTAIEFAIAFYDAIGSGRSYEFAYKLGCNAIQMFGIPGHSIPVLKQNSRIGLTGTPNDEVLSRIRRQLLRTNSEWELEKLSYDLENFLQDNPTYTEARMLRTQISKAISYAESRPLPQQVAPSSIEKSLGIPTSYRWGAILIAFITIALIIAVSWYLWLK